MNTHHTSTHHRHQPVSTSTRHGFYGCVNPQDCNPAAHFGDSSVDTCSCGATRSNNHFDGETEVGSRWGHSNNLAVVARQRREHRRLLTVAAAARSGHTIVFRAGGWWAYR